MQGRSEGGCDNVAFGTSQVVVSKLSLGWINGSRSSRLALTAPVTVAKDERTFSKFKLMKTLYKEEQYTT